MKRKKRIVVKLPSSKIPLYDYQLVKYVKKLKIPHFRGIFCRDELPKKPLKNECLILNLDTSFGEGTHWQAMSKQKNEVIVFDSFGRIPLLPELMHYLKGCHIYYNCMGNQGLKSVNCGHFVLKFLVKQYHPHCTIKGSKITI